MTRKLVLTLAGLALLAAPVLAGKYNKKVNIGDKAPRFAGIPAVLGDKETTLDLDAIKEDVVVLVFLSNDCPMVALYEDRIIDFVNEFKDKSVKVVGVGVNDKDSERLPAIKVRVKEKGYNYVYGYDETGAIGKAYGATRTPEIFVLDKARAIRYMGSADDEAIEDKVKKTYLKDAVNALLNGESPETTETRPNGCGIRYK